MARLTTSTRKLCVCPSLVFRIINIFCGHMHAVLVCYQNVLPVSYILLRSFKPPNLLFPASMLPARIDSMLFPCCFGPSVHPTFHSLVYIVSMLSIRTASMLSTRIDSMLFTCCFRTLNRPIFHSPYLYILPVCYLQSVVELQINCP